MFNMLTCQISPFTSQLIILVILSEKNHNRFQIKPHHCLRGKKKNHISVLFFFCSESPLTPGFPSPWTISSFWKDLEVRGKVCFYCEWMLATCCWPEDWSKGDFPKQLWSLQWWGRCLRVPSHCQWPLVLGLCSIFLRRNSNPQVNTQRLGQCEVHLEGFL